MNDYAFNATSGTLRARSCNCTVGHPADTAGDHCHILSMKLISCVYKCLPQAWAWTQGPAGIQKRICVLAAGKKKRQLILLFLICFACTRMHLKEMICMLLGSCIILFCGPLIFLAAKQNSFSSFLQSNSKSELLFWSFFRSGLKGSEWFRGFKISRFIQLKGFLSQLNKSNQQAWGSFHSRRWERRAGLRSVSLNTHNRFILLVRTSKLIVRSGWSLV